MVTHGRSMGKHYELTDDPSVTQWANTTIWRVTYMDSCDSTIIRIITIFDELWATRGRDLDQHCKPVDNPRVSHGRPMGKQYKLMMGDPWETCCPALYAHGPPP